MQKTINALLSEIIDYAGLFPPASLDLATAVNNYIKYSSSTDKWMLGRFICPVTRLTDLKKDHYEQITTGEKFRISLLATKCDSYSEFFEHLASDIDISNEFVDTFGEKVSLEILELQLPEETYLELDETKIETALRSISNTLKKVKFPYPQVFVEVPDSTGFPNRIRPTCRVLSKVNLNNSNTFPDFGFKLRCGGVTAESFPSIETVSEGIDAVISNRIPFKATAGLHHPIRRYNGTVATKMHGFLNVFGAGLLSKAYDLKQEKILEILSDESPGNFAVNDQGFHWQDFSISVNEINELRDSCFTSFGSCSFDEPREDLTEMKWL